MENISTGIPGIVAHITTSKTKDKKTILRGYAMDQRSGVRAGKLHQRTCASSGEDENHKKRILVSVIADEYRKNHKPIPEKTTPIPCPGIFTQTYNQFRKLGIENPNWNENTAKSTFSFFERNVLPPLDCYGYGLCSEDIATIQAALVEKAAKNKGGRQNLNIAENSVSSYLFRVNWILTNMYALNTALPEHLFRTKAHAKIPLNGTGKISSGQGSGSSGFCIVCAHLQWPKSRRRRHVAYGSAHQ